MVRVRGGLCLPGIPQPVGQYFMVYGYGWVCTGDRGEDIPAPTSGQVGSASLVITVQGKVETPKEGEYKCLFKCLYLYDPG